MIGEDYGATSSENWNGRRTERDKIAMGKLFGNGAAFHVYLFFTYY